MWPHFDSAAKKCQTMYSDYKQGKDISKYKTTGTEDKRVIEPKKTRREDESPMKYTDTSLTQTQKGQPPKEESATK